MLERARRRERLGEKVCWVTGASSGIGEALVLELAARGAKLVISARRAERLEALRLRCPDPSRVAVLPLDVADTARADEHARTALIPFGRIDVMVHNAGIGQRSRALETALDVDRRIMEVNYFGVIALTKALLPAMIAHGGGHLVVVSSVVGHVGTPLRSAYSASKHALHGFFDALRAEEGARGVRVTLVCPGFVKTELAERALVGDGRARGTTEGRGIEPAACASRIARAIERAPNEVYVGGAELAAIYLQRFAPRVLAGLLPRVLGS
jgi:dehydrogenase/reductase SDR family protein 7B